MKKNVIIPDKVYYIGVNDRTTPKFEGLWPLPAGVSYNSYLVKGASASAIIDGVEVSHALEQIELIRNLTPERAPEYLIINHMEPDHSGGIAILRQAFPGIKIVGNNQTLAMVKGYYGLAGGTVAVKEGESIDLGGGVVLQFYLTPMVHWPETMFTFMPGEGCLFSGDAFGCFGALNGAALDSEMDTERYFPEMVRYYSNIVGKYGQFVQRALKKLEPLQISTICSTHGPVWRTQKDKVIAIYDRLSRYEPLDNGVTIVYGSMYGNTTLMAEAAAEALADAGVRDIAMYDAARTDLSFILADIFRHRGLIIAAPTYSDSLFPPVASFLEAVTIRGIRNRAVAVLGSHTWSQRAIGIIKQALDNLDVECVAEPVNGKQAPSADVLAQCAMAAKALAQAIRQ